MATLMAQLGKKNLDIITIKDTALLRMSFCDDKISKIISNIMDHPQDKHIVYTNYTSSVIPTLETKFTDLSLKVYIISGAIPFDERRDTQKKINSSMDPCVIVLSSVGAEGLNFTNVRFVHIVEPYWYYGRIL
jgi:superfamily II DNA/RNA helicase